MLPHVQRKWERVQTALKQASLYVRVEPVPRHAEETTLEFTRRFVARFAQRPRATLLVNTGGCLDDGRWGTAECLALPHLRAAVVLRLVGNVRIVGLKPGVNAIAAALRLARVAYVREVCGHQQPCHSQF